MPCRSHDRGQYIGGPPVPHLRPGAIRRRPCQIALADQLRQFVADAVACFLGFYRLARQQHRLREVPEYVGGALVLSCDSVA